MAKSMGDKRRVILDFETKEMATVFLGWLCDGAGEDMYRNSLESEGYDAIFEYNKAFPAWGYNKQKDGPDRVVKILKGGKVGCERTPRDEIS